MSGFQRKMTRERLTLFIVEKLAYVKHKHHHYFVRSTINQQQALQSNSKYDELDQKIKSRR